jgi:hypothetical protein
VDEEGKPRLFQINSAGDVTEGREFVLGESDFGPDELREAVRGVDGGQVLELLKRAMAKRADRLENSGYDKGAFEHVAKARIGGGEGECGFTHVLRRIDK